MAFHFSFISKISDISSAQWQALAQNAGPFLQHGFLSLLESTECVGEATGWQPMHLIIYDDNVPIAAMPGYIKYDSYGEYVFDHSWANAYHQYGYSYYPKWISAIPFTPVTGPRLLLADHVKEDVVRTYAAQAIDTLAQQNISSAHILFPPLKCAGAAVTAGYLKRVNVQFQWHNYDYQHFDDFLAALTSRKRKALRKSRQQLSAANVTIKRYTGADISAPEQDFFYLCYQQTYLKRSGHNGYLSEGFFKGLFATMAENMLLVVAYQDENPVASALFLYDATGLYGRYWGSLVEIDGLHFECCYFQGIEFAIEKKQPLFNPGTQGEHKILRGFEPIYCVSFHKLFAPAFHHAVSNFLYQETPAMVEYYHQAAEVLPFNNTFLPNLKTMKTPDVHMDNRETKQRNDK
ncbi:N-acetyltransferase [Alteromonas pelagimontana]|uniref:N-acetyltransferase n=1 Tax=Alteromonas pelagimontana TaxID=1858656 RepID=A0A6M4MGA6_9ALTE|nr:GNAT family N-acetyltransferase [Alteromonas pelagimontana]QJR81888.1 N-acetyltransferase [Alteromonas pelagimontana]